MHKLFLLLTMIACLSACAVPPGQIRKESAPGQIMKDTGYNPASGKIKNK